MGGEWPLVGRRQELEALRAALREPESAGMVVAGPAGVGKTRLARAAMADLAATADCEWVMATHASRSIPFGALAHLLSTPSDAGASWSGQDRFELLHAAIGAVKGRTGGRRLVLGVDDAHLLDDGAATLIQQLAITGTVQLVLTTRAGEATPDAVVALWKDGLIGRLELRPLGPAEAGELLAAVLGSQVEQRTVTRLWSTSGGNALFLKELVLGALDDGTLATRDGIWVWRGQVRATPRLKELIQARLGHLGPDQRKVVEVLAVGEPLTHSVLANVAPTGGLAGLEDKALVRVGDEADPVVSLAHPLQAEVLRASLPVTTRRTIQRQLAAALAGPGGRDADLRRALWTLDGGGALDPALAARAARAAVELFEAVVAERLARTALEHGPSFDASLTLAEALNQQNRYQESDTTLGPLQATAADDRQLTAVALERRSSLFFGLGRADECRAVLRRAAAEVSDRSLAARLRTEEALVAAYSGHLREGMELVLAVLAEDDIDEVVKLRALSVAGPGWANAGQSAKALAACEAAIEPLFRWLSTVPEAVSWVGLGRFVGLVLAGRLDDADAQIEMAESFEPGARFVEKTAFLGLGRGKVALLRGQPATAARSLREAVLTLGEFDPGHIRPWAQCMLAEALALTGETAAAAELVIDSRSRPVAGLYEGDLRRAHCWPAAAQGQRSHAVELVMEAADWCRADGQYGIELHALHDALRLGGVTAAAVRLIEVSAAVDGAWAGAFAQHAKAVVAADPGDLERAASTFEDLGALLLAAEATAEAASLLGSESQWGREVAARAARLAARCEGACTPSLAALG